MKEFQGFMLGEIAVSSVIYCLLLLKYNSFSGLLCDLLGLGHRKFALCAKSLIISYLSCF